jgi:hypothetical protein
VNDLVLDNWQSITPVLRNEEGVERTLVCMKWRGLELHIGTVPVEVTSVSSFNITPSFHVDYPPCTWFGRPVHIDPTPIPKATYYAFVRNGCKLEEPIQVYAWMKNPKVVSENSVLLTVNSKGQTIPLALCEKKLPNQFFLVEHCHILFQQQVSGLMLARKNSGPVAAPVENPESHPDFNAWYDTFFVHSGYEDRAQLAISMLKDIPSSFFSPFIEDISVIYVRAERDRLGYKSEL